MTEVHSKGQWLAPAFPLNLPLGQIQLNQASACSLRRPPGTHMELNDHELGVAEVGASSEQYKDAPSSSGVGTYPYEPLMLKWS